MTDSMSWLGSTEDGVVVAKSARVMAARLQGVWRDHLSSLYYVTPSERDSARSFVLHHFADRVGTTTLPAAYHRLRHEEVQKKNAL